MGRSGAIPLGMQKPGTSFTPVFKEEGRRKEAEGRRKEAEGREEEKEEKPISILDYDTPSSFFFIDYYIHVHAPPPPLIYVHAPPPPLIYNETHSYNKTHLQYKPIYLEETV